jgi:hypothetical protein
MARSVWLRLEVMIAMVGIAAAGCGDDGVGATDGGPQPVDAAMRDGGPGGADGGGAAADGGVAADGGGGADGGGAADEEMLANVPSIAECAPSSGYAVFPLLPDELGHYAATHLTPPAYPFAVTRVAYDLVAPSGVAQCTDLSFAHEVQLIVTSAPLPPASPSTADGTTVTTIAVPAGATGARVVELALATPITLTTGQSLYVAVEMAGDATHALCLGRCVEEPAPDGQDYWSGAASEPFSWTDLAEYDLASFTIRAYGHR